MPIPASPRRTSAPLRLAVRGRACGRSRRTRPSCPRAPLHALPTHSHPSTDGRLDATRRATWRAARWRGSPRSALRSQMRVNGERRRGPGHPERARGHAELALVERGARVDLQLVGGLLELGSSVSRTRLPAASNSPSTWNRPPTGSLTAFETKRTSGWRCVSKKSADLRCSSRLSLPVFRLLASIVSSSRRRPSPSISSQPRRRSNVPWTCPAPSNSARETPLGIGPGRAASVPRRCDWSCRCSSDLPSVGVVSDASGVAQVGVAGEDREHERPRGDDDPAAGRPCLPAE